MPRKGGPGITGSDLLVLNKVDLAEAVGADMEMMERQAKEIREGGPVILAVVKDAGGQMGVKYFVDLVVSAWKGSGAYEESVRRWELGWPRGSMETAEQVRERLLKK